MNALTKLAVTEAKLFTRDLSSVVLPLAMPVLLLLAWGSVGDMRVPAPELGGQRPLDAIIAPIAIAVALGSLGLMTLPVYLASYREKGILRRLSVTPAHPLLLLVAQLLVHLATAALAVVLALGVGAVVWDVALPRQLPVFAGVVLLGAAALFAVGLLIAAVAPRASAATTIGTLAFFPMAALGGAFVPRDMLPDVVAGIGDITPLGAALQAVGDVWAGARLDPANLAVLAAHLVVAGALAARWFRWE